MQRNKILSVLYFLVILSLSTPYGIFAQTAEHTFALGDSTFLLDGKPFLMISGELHYPRIPREAWRQRMHMAKAMGLNTIGTYVFWNLHEPEKGKFDFSGNNDIAAFVRTAQEEGLWVVLRPSPYVCAEWEFGGYPYWLQNEKGLVVRSLESTFISEYKKYINEVAKHIAPLQINQGGNVLMIQVENEYGFYSNDKKYLETCKNIFVEAGFDGLLYTCDPASKIEEGHLSPLLPAVNGLVAPAKVKELVRRYHNGKGPFYIAEWYPAWFDWWGTQHHTVPPEKYAAKLDSILAAGISVNMYMFHGGTTRGFMNGANYNDHDPFEPQISSYDYDAPLDEAGNPTEKFIQFRKIISRHLSDGNLPAIPASKSAASLGSIHLTESADLKEAIKVPVKNSRPLAFEDINQAYGYVMYRTQLDGGKSGVLKIDGLRDYAVVLVNGVKVGTLDRRLKQETLWVSFPNGKVTLDLLAENLGRINFGPYLLDNRKGITRNVKFDGAELLGWEMFGMPLNDISAVKFSKEQKNNNAPIFRRGSFALDAPADTYLDFRNWGKGCAWINGHNLGRYWSIGPQQTIYVPAEWLKQGKNDLVIFEMLRSDQTTIETLERPILDQITREKTEP